MMVNIEQPKHAILRDILAEAGRPMTLSEIATEWVKLGVAFNGTAVKAVSEAIYQRQRFAGDVRGVQRGIWEFCKN